MSPETEDVNRSRFCPEQPNQEPGFPVIQKVWFYNHR